MPSHHPKLIAALVVGALALLASTASARPPATVSCGQTLTHSVKLTADLENCPGDGVIIGAAGITVDLNGHTIDGVRTSGCDRPAVFTAGVSNPGGYDGATVEDGTVQQFDGGVSAGSQSVGMSDGTIRGLLLRDNRFGGVSLGSGADPAATAGNRVDHNRVSGSPCGDGLEINTGRGNRFTHNRIESTNTAVVICCGGLSDGNVVEHNRVAGTTGIGMLVFDSGHTRIGGNVLSDIGDNGIQIVGASASTVVDDNTVTRVQFAGIAVLGCSDDCGGTLKVPTDVRVTGNELDASGDGIALTDTDRDVVRGNSVTGAGSFGDPGSFGLGILLNGVSDTVVSGNAIADSGRGPGPGILIGIPLDFLASPRPVAGNSVMRNTITRQHADGLLVAPIAQNTTLERNSADHNAGDGLNVLSPATTLRRNRADDNAAFGIEAVAGVTDGGGNRARGNGIAAQCIGVACG
jgi:large repetitive protein